MANSLLFFHFILFCIPRISDPVANDNVVDYFQLKCIQNLLEMVVVHDFPAWAESEGTFSTVVCGGCIILIITQNNRIKISSVHLLRLGAPKLLLHNVQMM